MTQDRMCFACGQDNPISLGLKFKVCDNNKVKAEFVPKSEHQGFDNIMHGGLVSTLMDEAMAKVLDSKGIKAFTAEMKSRFKHPVKIGTNLIIYGVLKDSYGKLFFTESKLVDNSGNIYARAQGKFMEQKQA